MKNQFICVSVLILLITGTLFSQDYNKNLFLKDYSGEMIITTQVREKETKLFYEEPRQIEIGNLF